jgi:hypothetical protein
MKEKITDLTINGLIGLGVLISLEITQATWGLDVLPEHLEPFVYGLTAAISALILCLFLASFIIELQAINKNLEAKNKNNEDN